jgi:hypothetical protein
MSSLSRIIRISSPGVGMTTKRQADFLAVIDADPASPGYGQVVATAPTGVAGSMPHHTEVEMPIGGLLMANGFEAGRTWVFDLRDPLQPHIVASFGDLDGYMHPHTYFRLPNGNVLATFQYRGGMGRKRKAAACSRLTMAGTCSALAAPRTGPLLAS